MNKFSESTVKDAHDMALPDLVSAYKEVMRIRKHSTDAEAQRRAGGAMGLLEVTFNRLKHYCSDSQAKLLAGMLLDAKKESLRRPN